MNWLIKQITSPSTHNALAAFSASITPLIPPPYGVAATAFFALLGVLIPEPGENIPMPAVTKMLIPFILLIGLTACSQTAALSSQSAACVGQSVVNAVTQSAINANDSKLASAGSIASAGLGALCTGLASDTALTVQPAPVNPLPSKPSS